MKPIDVKDNTYIDSMELHSTDLQSNEDLEFKVDDHARTSRIFVINKVKNAFP